jgi:hypothetical protein
LSRGEAGAAVTGTGTDGGIELGAAESASVAAAAFRDARADSLSRHKKKDLSFFIDIIT